MSVELFSFMFCEIFYRYPLLHTCCKCYRYVAKFLFLTALLMETSLKQARAHVEQMAELHEDQDQLSDFLVAECCFFSPLYLMVITY